MSRKIDVASLEPIIGTLYPPPFAAPCLSREPTRLGDAAGLTSSASTSCACRPAPGRASATGTPHEDEFVYVLKAR